jgi:hypothetical protein
MASTMASTMASLSTVSVTANAASSASPLPLPVIDIGLALSGIDLSLFDNVRKASSANNLSAAVALAARVPAASVTVRRVRDVSDPAAPVVIYSSSSSSNPLSSSDAYMQRRRRLRSGSVQVDLQILLPSTAAASALGAALAAAPQLLAASIAEALSSQGSPLAASLLVTATVQAFPNAGATASTSSAPPFPAVAAVAAVIIAFGAIVLITVWIGRNSYLRRRREVSVAPEAQASRATWSPPGSLKRDGASFDTAWGHSATSAKKGACNDVIGGGFGAAERALSLSASIVASPSPSLPLAAVDAMAPQAMPGLPKSEVVVHTLSSAAGGVAAALSAAAPSVPLVGLALSAISVLLSQLQNMSVAAAAASALSARLSRLQTLVHRAASFGEGERGENGEGSFSNEHPGIFQSLVDTLLRADLALRAISERSSLGTFIGSSGDTELVAAIDRAISLHVAELSAALSAETMASVRLLHLKIQSLQSSADAAAQQQQLQPQPELAAPLSPASLEEPAVTLPPFSVSLKLSDIAFEPPLEEQLQTAERGTSGVVVLATWRPFGLPVAVKVLNARMATGEAAIPITAWLAEAELMRRLREHKTKYVVTLFGISATLDALGVCDRYLVVMERLGGGSLRALLDGYLARGRRPPLAQALQWMLDTARGVAECHEASVVHSDVKAANIFLDDSRRAKLGDLGSGRVTRGLSASASAVAVTSTEAGAGRSSVLWLSSELVDDPKQQPSTFSDVFAWAVTAWEILSCQLPYHNANGVLVVDIMRPRIMMDLVSGELRPDISALRPDAPHAVVALIQRCWAADPHERPAIVDVAHALEASVGAIARLRASAAERAVLMAAASDSPSDSLRAAEVAAAEEDARAAAEDLAALRASVAEARSARLAAIQRRREEAERELRAEAAAAAAALEVEGAAWLADESARAKAALAGRHAALIGNVGLARAKRLREGGAGLGEADRARIVAEFEAEQRAVELKLDEERERQAAALRERLAERRAAKARAAEERASERQRELDECARRDAEAERSRGDDEVLRAGVADAAGLSETTPL